MKKLTIIFSLLTLSFETVMGSILENLKTLSPRIKVESEEFTSPSGREGPKSIGSGDFDQDGKDDFVTANLDGSLAVVYGMGEGAFEDAVFLESGGISLRGLTALDLNDDTFFDFVAADPVGGQLSITLSTGARTYSEPIVSEQWQGARQIISGHFNTDEHLDLLLAGPTPAPNEGEIGPTGLRILAGDGTGSFTSMRDLPNPASSILPKESYTKPVFNLATFRNPNLSADSIVIGNAFNSQIYVLNPSITDTELTYVTSPQTLPVYGVIEFQTAQIIGDENEDLVMVSKEENEIIIIPGSSPVQENPWAGMSSIDIEVAGAPRSVEIADINGDQRQDLIVVLRNFDRVVMFENRESEGFVLVSEVPTGGSPREIAAVEWNNDGLADFLVINRHSADVNIYSSDADLGGIGVSSQIYSVDGSVAQLGVRDLNNDGRDDVIQLHTATNEFSVRLAGPDGLLLDPVCYPTGLNPVSFTLADSNQDGDADLLVTNIGSATGGSSLSVSFGNGDGTFDDPQITPDFEGNMFAIVAADFDQDGISDLAIGYFDCRVVFFRGLPSGTFERRSVHRFAYEARSMITGDFDQDGDPDIAGTGAGGDLVVLANNGDFFSSEIAERYDSKENFSGRASLFLTESDGNNDPDLLVIAPSVSLIFPGIEGVQFGEPTHEVDSSSDTGNAAFFDLNQDNIPDLISTCRLLSCISVSLGTAENEFVFAGNIDTPQSDHVAFGDLDGDGEPDLVGSGASLWTVLCNPPPARPSKQIRNAAERPVINHPVINEILSSNSSIEIPGSAGSPDAIEIYYGGSDPVSLAGWSLRLETPREVNDYIISPDSSSPLILETGQRHLIIFSKAIIPNHTGFNLPRQGGTLSLISPDGVIDSVEYPELETDTSYARFQDGISAFSINQNPDLGSVNLDNGIIDPELKFTSFSPVITETGSALRVLAKGSDDIGIFTLTMNYRRLDLTDAAPASLLLFDDGQHGDGEMGDGIFANDLPPEIPPGALIEFFFTAVDLLGGQTSKPGSSVFASPEFPTEHYKVRIGEPRTSPGLQISEVVSKNQSGITEQNGKTVDWVEIRNTSDSPASLASISVVKELFGELSDAYQFPSETILQPGEYYIIFADNDPLDGPLHAPFRIDADGDQLLLVERDENNIESILNIIDIPPLNTDTSWSRIASSDHSLIGSPTPGLSNGPESLSLIPNGENYLIIFPTTPGENYQLNSSNDLRDTSSSPVMQGTGTGIENFTTAPFQDRLFYWLN